jgi:hypothetical protein
VVVEAVAHLVRDAENGAMPTIEEIFRHARSSLESLAVASERTVDDFATTLAVAVAHDDYVAVGQVGDGIIVVRDQSGVIRSLVIADRFEYANETVFLSAADWDANLKVDRLPAADVAGIALSTDGLRFKILEDLATGVPYAPFFEDAFGWVDSDSATSTAVANFIGGLDDQSGDDKTLVIAGRRVRGREGQVCVVNSIRVDSPPLAADATDATLVSSDDHIDGPDEEPAPRT